MSESPVFSSRVDSEFTDAIRAELAVEVLPRPSSVEQRRDALLRALAKVCRGELVQRWARTQGADAQALAQGPVQAQESAQG